MKKRLIVVLSAVLFLVGVSAASETATDTAPEFKSTWKNPAPGFTTYGDIRLRQVYGWEWYLNNDTGTPGGKDGHHNFGRYRARIGEKVDINEDVTFDVRLAWEFRAWDDPVDKDNHVDGDEAIIDRMNFTMRNLLNEPLTGVFGRQDITMNPWLIFDGTPYDGSRTMFFDALRLTYDFEDVETKVDMIYVDNRAEANDRLKPIGDEDLYLTEQDEHGAILYLTNKSLQDTTLEGYFIYKNDNPIDEISKKMPASWSRKAEIYTFGGAVAGDIDLNWQYRVEGAVQTGDKDIDGGSVVDTKSLRAYGSNNYLKYKFNDEKKNSLRLDYEYLSGDDKGTDGRVEGFDTLWGEWPRFSELYVYTYAMEGIVGDLSNLHRTGLIHEFDPMGKMHFENGYQLLWAEENSTGPRFGGGLFRGQLLTSRLSYKFTKDLSGRLEAEYFIPGSYYDDNFRNNATFLRAEIVYSF